MQPTEHHVVAHHPHGRLEWLDPSHWEAFCRGHKNLRPELAIVVAGGHPPYGDERASRAVDVLLITLRRDPGTRAPMAESIEPVRIGVDEQGYLCRLHLELAPVPDSGIVDLRPQLASRYLRRAWSWRPSAELVRAALGLCAGDHEAGVAEG